MIVENLKKYYKRVSLVLVICGLSYILFPLVDEVIKIKMTKIMINESYTLKDRYRPNIKKMTFVDGHFIMFITKPLLFKPGQAYIYTSANGTSWEKQKNIFEKRSYSWGSGFPLEYKNKCLSYSSFTGGVLSLNCKDKWQQFNTKLPNKIWINSQYMRDGNYEYNIPLTYKDKLVFVFKRDKNIKTSQLIVNHELLYKTNDGINWDELNLNESELQYFIKENYLQQAPLTESISYSGNVPIAYNLPEFPQNNIKAYQVLLAINNFYHLDLDLQGELTAFGNDSYIGVFTKKNTYDYYMIISKDKVTYQIIRLPTNVTGFLTDIFF